MRAIPLHQPCVADHIQQNERHERDVVTCCDRDIRLVKCRGVRPPVNRQRFHAAQQHGNAALLRGLDDVAQVVGDLRDRHAAQPVVHADRDDQHANVPLERAIEPRARVRGRVPGNAGVDHFVRKPGATHALMQQRGIGGGRSDPVTGSQAVAEADDPTHAIKDSRSVGGSQRTRPTFRWSPPGRVLLDPA